MKTEIIKFISLCIIYNERKLNNTSVSKIKMLILQKRGFQFLILPFTMKDKVQNNSKEIVTREHEKNIIATQQCNFLTFLSLIVAFSSCKLANLSANKGKGTYKMPSLFNQ